MPHDGCADAVMTQEWGGVSTFQVPEDVHDDFLESYLLLDCARRMHVGMLPRKLQWAADCLNKPLYEELSEYADRLMVTFSGRMHPSLPRPIRVDAQPASSAEHWRDSCWKVGPAHCGLLRAKLLSSCAM